MKKRPLIQYVSKDKIAPSFGKYWHKTALIEIRRDLPVAARHCILEHELAHHRGWGEIGANAISAWKHPWGFIVTAVMSLSPTRLAFYWRRITGRDK